MGDGWRKAQRETPANWRRKCSALVTVKGREGPGGTRGGRGRWKRGLEEGEERKGGTGFEGKMGRR